VADNKEQPLKADVFTRGCPSRETMLDITGRWGLLALAALAEGPYRFGALRRRIDGVSERMLAQTLQRLERDGLITRTVLGTMPPAVEYALTDLGRVLADRVAGIITLVESTCPQVMAARAEYDAREATTG
jgi:DNA-binding HxlR family transcriptional regulator